MKKGLFILAAIGLFGTTSCELIGRKMQNSFSALDVQQSHMADSMRHSIIRQRSHYTANPAFAIRMDTLYASGFHLADLMDSLRIHPSDEHWTQEYAAELHFFRNYVNHNFEYDDRINTLQTSIGMGSLINKKENGQAKAVKFMVPMMNAMIKPGIMEIILACRSQYPAGEAQDTTAAP